MNQQAVKSPAGRQAGLMSLGTLLSRILGFARDLLIAAFFSKFETDVFFAAFRLPNFFRRLLGEGSFSAGATPALTEALQREGGRAQAEELHSCLFTLLFCLACFLTLLGSIFMDSILGWVFGGTPYAAIEGKLEKTILAARVVFAYLFFVSLYAYFMSALQAFGRFFLAAAAPALFNLSLIICALAPPAWLSSPSLALSWAALFGGLLQLLPVLYEMHRLKLWPRFSFKWRNPLLAKAVRRFLPGALGLSGLSLIGLINVYFAGWLEEGSLSYIYYGDRLLELPRSLIAVSLGTALIPELTKKYSLEKTAEFKNIANYYLRFLLFLTLPCALVFIFAAEPVVELLFGRGEFDKSSVLKTAMVLQIYSIVLVFSALSRVCSSCFFAVNKNWHTALFAFCFVCFHFLSAWLLTPAFGLKGLVGATALSSVFHFFLLAGGLFYLIGGISLRPLLKLLWKSLPGFMLMILCFLFYPYLHSALAFLLPAGFALFLSLSLVLLSAGGLYILSGFLLKEEMALEFLSLFRQLLEKFKNMKLRAFNR